MLASGLDRRDRYTLVMKSCLAGSSRKVIQKVCDIGFNIAQLGIVVCFKIHKPLT